MTNIRLIEDGNALMLYKKYAVNIVILSILLISCVEASSNQVHCTCSNYAEINTSDVAPDWTKKVDSEDENFYYSSGIAECIISARDIKNTDVSARNGLATRLSSTIISRFNIMSERRVVSDDVNIRSEAYRVSKQKIEQFTKVYMENSQIVERWIDLNTCNVYSLARISKKDWAAAKELAEDEYKYTPINNNISVVSHGEYRDKLKSNVEKVLTDIDQSLERSKQHDTGFLLKVRLTEIEPCSGKKSEGHALCPMLHLDLLWSKNGRTLDGNSIPLKGVSHNISRNDQLIGYAILDSQELHNHLMQILNKSYSKDIKRRNLDE